LKTKQVAGNLSVENGCRTCSQTSGSGRKKDAWKEDPLYLFAEQYREDRKVIDGRLSRPRPFPALKRCQNPAEPDASARVENPKDRSTKHTKKQRCLLLSCFSCSSCLKEQRKVQAVMGSSIEAVRDKPARSSMPGGKNSDGGSSRRIRRRQSGRAMPERCEVSSVSLHDEGS
jgi:hypothetical protein